MKKISALIFILTLMLSTSVFAADVAVKQGTWEFGLGNVLSFTNYSNDDVDMDLNVFSIGTFGNGISSNYLDLLLPPIPSLNVDYFIIPNLGIGLVGGYAMYKEDDMDDALGMWFIGPELKYYIGIMDNLQVDAHIGFVYVGADAYDDTTADPDDIITVDQSSLKLGLALNYFIGNNFAVVLGFDYTRLFNGNWDGEEVDDSYANAITIGLGFKVFLGF